MKSIKKDRILELMGPRRQKGADKRGGGGCGEQRGGQKKGRGEMGRGKDKRQFLFSSRVLE